MWMPHEEWDCQTSHLLQQVVWQAAEKGTLAEEAVAALSGELAHLMDWQARRYLLGQGDSMPVELAERVLESLLFTVGYALRRQGSDAEMLAVLGGKPPSGVPKAKGIAPCKGAPAGVVQSVQRQNIPAPAPEEGGRLLPVYKAGRAMLRAGTERARRLWRACRNMAVKTPAVCYHDSMGRGVGVFFDNYDVEFFAAEIPADIDYPLAVPPGGEGLEYMEAWLGTLLLENRFCRRVNPAALHRLMQNLQPEYATLPLNLFEPAFLAAAACRLAGEEPAALVIIENPAFWAGLNESMESDDRAAALLEDAAKGLCAAFELKAQDPLAGYMHRVLHNAAPLMANAARHRQLQQYLGMREY